MKLEHIALLGLGVLIVPRLMDRTTPSSITSKTGETVPIVSEVTYGTGTYPVSSDPAIAAEQTRYTQWRTADQLLDSYIRSYYAPAARYLSDLEEQAGGYRASGYSTPVSLAEAIATLKEKLVPIETRISELQAARDAWR